MGCIASYLNTNGSEQTKPARKWNFSSRFDCSESSYTVTEETSCGTGRYTSTSECNWSSSSAEAPTPAPRIIAKSEKKLPVLPKMPVCPKLSPMDMPKVLARLTFNDAKTKCKDVTTEPVGVQVPAQVFKEHSSGYSTSEITDLDSTCSSLSYNSFLLHTQDMSVCSEQSEAVESSNNDTTSEYSYQGIFVKGTKSNIIMEINLVSENIQVMPKTSSPLYARRTLFPANSDLSLNNDDYDNDNDDSILSDTYNLWIECLQEQPFSRIRDVTAIPEAVAGLFSPADHPAYTAVNNCEYVSAPKGFHALQNLKNAKSAPHCHWHTRFSDVTLDLVLPDDYLNKGIIISTEL